MCVDYNLNHNFQKIHYIYQTIDFIFTFLTIDNMMFTKCAYANELCCSAANTLNSYVTDYCIHIGFVYRIIVIGVLHNVFITTF